MLESSEASFEINIDQKNYRVEAKISSQLLKSTIKAKIVNQQVLVVVNAQVLGIPCFLSLLCCKVFP